MLYGKLISRKVFLLIVFISLISVFSSKIVAQKDNEEETFKPHHQLGISINHVHVFEGKNDEGKKKMLSLPAWGIDYTYHFSKKWAVGLHTDIVIEKFKVEKIYASGSDEEIVERSYPIAPAVMGIYKPHESWNFLLGFGGEFAKEENYFLTRAGVEYGYELPKDWEIFGAVNYDFKWNAYNSWGICLGIAKSFGEK